MAIQENKSKASWKCYEKERIWSPPPLFPNVCVYLTNMSSMIVNKAKLRNNSKQYSIRLMFDLRKHNDLY